MQLDADRRALALAVCSAACAAAARVAGAVMEARFASERQRKVGAIVSQFRNERLPDEMSTNWKKICRTAANERSKPMVPPPGSKSRNGVTISTIHSPANVSKRCHARGAKWRRRDSGLGTGCVS
eukprot:scaffold178221_cov32-Tisochrysis_lutea.AAC.2